MIKSFRSKPLKRFATTGDASKLPVQGDAAIARLIDQLVALDVVAAPEGMDVPGWHFHGLRGKPTRYSVRVTANYRLTWGWTTPDATDLDLEDYH